MFLGTPAVRPLVDTGYDGVTRIDFAGSVSVDSRAIRLRLINGARHSRTDSTARAEAVEPQPTGSAAQIAA